MGRCLETLGKCSYLKRLTRDLGVSLPAYLHPHIIWAFEKNVFEEGGKNVRLSPSTLLSGQGSGTWGAPSRPWQAAPPAITTLPYCDDIRRARGPLPPHRSLWGDAAPAQRPRRSLTFVTIPFKASAKRAPLRCSLSPRSSIGPGRAPTCAYGLLPPPPRLPVRNGCSQPSSCPGTFRILI